MSIEGYQPELTEIIENQVAPASVKDSETLAAAKSYISEKHDELIKLRQEQSFESRLAEYLTGLRPEDSRMAERLIEDQKIIRAKYGLPDRSIRWDFPTTYERLLNDMAREADVQIRATSDCGDFFSQHAAGGVYDEVTKVIGIDINRDTEDSYAASLGKLEHEIIHSLQYARTPNMPIELMEYEAYIAGASTKYLKDHPDSIEPALFNFFIGGSVRHHYNSLSKQQGREVNPEWDSAEYFLAKVDQVDSSESTNEKEGADNSVTS